MERKSRKIYYTMGEVSEMFDVNPSLIRFWEQKFDILKPDKNKKGNRLFTPRDVENLKLIYHLVKENGMTLSGAAKRLRENREGVERNLEIIEKLQGIRALLLEVRQELKGGDAGEVFVDTELPEEVVPAGIPGAEAGAPDAASEAERVPVATDNGCEAGPVIPPFIQTEIPMPPQPVPVSLVRAPVPAAGEEPVEESPRPSGGVTVIEQTLF